MVFTEKLTTEFLTFVECKGFIAMHMKTPPLVNVLSQLKFVYIYEMRCVVNEIFCFKV